MKFRILPPLVMVIFGCCMWLVAKFLPVGRFAFFGRQQLMYVLAALGFTVIILALFQFKRQKTTTNPIDLKKTTTLVTKGIFNYSRNPMYLAMLLLLLAFALKMGNAFNVLIAAGFVGYMNRFQIAAEEQALEQQFGKTYRTYCSHVRRWF